MAFPFKRVLVDRGIFVLKLWAHWVHKRFSYGKRDAQFALPIILIPMYKADYSSSLKQFGSYKCDLRRKKGQGERGQMRRDLEAQN